MTSNKVHKPRSKRNKEFDTLENPVSVNLLEDDPDNEVASGEDDPKNFLVRSTVDAEQRYKCEDWPCLEDKVIPRATPLIRNAAAPDIKHIVALADDLCLGKAKKRGKDLKRSSGFFLSHLSAQEYTEYMATAEHFLVLHVDGKLIGFILAYSSELIDPSDPNEEVDVHIRDVVAKDQPFVLVKQLAVAHEYKRLGYLELLYMEVYARVVHWHGDDDNPRPVYTEIPASHPALQDFHKGVGYPVQEAVKFTPSGTTPLSFRSEQRLILANHYVTDSLNAIASSFAGNSTLDTRPVYDSSSMLDPHCVGVGTCLYWIEPPEPNGSFYADVRIMLKWRQPGIEKLYQHPRLKGSNVARTPIDMEAHAKEMRIPRYSLNEFDTETTQKYAYIDKQDPEDVITLQHVMRGKFIGQSLNLRDFPADTQMLEFKFRMWDNDPDDRCRYFRELYYVDNTAWQLGVKRVVDVPTCSFLATQVILGKDETAGTSYLTVRIPCVRNTGYYLRTVAIPLFFISSLTLTSIGLEGLAPRIEINVVLLLTNVAYLFIANDETPKTAHVTKLDLVTYLCFLAPWFLIVLNYISYRTDLSLTTTDLVSYVVCGSVIGFVGAMIFAMRTLYVVKIRQNAPLGHFDKQQDKK